jgi:DNA/RNA-binding domain of Phe-tRNA-synthetase-like protein
MITLSKAWQDNVPECSIGVLCLENCHNQSDHPALAAARADLVQDLVSELGPLDRKSLREMPVYSAYDAFYRRFRKTYHVQLQLESVIHKGKSIFSPSALVSVMFMAELKTGLLTAAHDLDVISGKLTADVASGNETFIRMDGSDQVLKEGDLFIHDEQGVLSSVIYGPDRRTQIRAATSTAVYTTYGPPGISRDQIREQLEILEGYARIFAPDLDRVALQVL